MDGAPKQYDFREVEGRWQRHWAETSVYAWDPGLPRDQSYVIDTPPPTVSGSLHIGHVYSYTQTDLIARFQRMRGKNVFYPIGFDDNGLPTERLVEQTRKIRAVDMSREEFTAICHDVVNEAEVEFRNLFTSIALSVDWSQLYQTVSADSRRISQMSLLDLYGKDHLYRRPEPSLWDVVDRTALAQAEVVDKEQPGTLWEIPFALEGGGEAVIATTRPELLAGCGALFIHEDHPRAAELIGRNAITPLFGVPVPIRADHRADPEKGTGIVMCCTFGDTTDIEWWRDHQLPTRVIVTPDGRIDDLSGIGGANWPSHDVEGARAAAAELSGLKVKAAREKTIELLEAQGRVRNRTEVTRMVPCAERSGAPLEILVTPQWFVRTLDKKQALLDKGRQINWYPDYMRVRYEIWVENLKWDWCISRQRYFGVPFPFWYSRRAGEEGRVLVAHPDDLPVNPLVDLPRGYSRDEVVPDTDVMDTWATSSVSPQLNSRGIDGTLMLDPKRHASLFPADLRPQAHEIIRTWAFYTILKAHLHQDTVPWHNIAISGWCLAQDRTKMSKSKGNVVTPHSLLEKYGADVVRYWTATSRLGLDTALSEDVLKVGKRLVTKLWNAARFAALQLDGFDEQPVDPAADVAAGIISQPLDLWILGRLAATVERADASFATYEYADAMEATERFFWADFCDNYLELVKARAYGEGGADEAGRRSARFTLWHCLDTVLRLFAPALPHVTEELYAQILPGRFKAMGSIHARSNWPQPARQWTDAGAVETGAAAMAVVAAVRKVKSLKAVSIKTPVTRLDVAPAPGQTAAALGPWLADLAPALGAASITLVGSLAPGAETVLTEDGRHALIVELGETPPKA